MIEYMNATITHDDEVDTHPKLTSGSQLFWSHIIIIN